MVNVGEWSPPDFELFGKRQPMRPEADPSWPQCAQACQEVWCTHVRDYLIANKDAPAIQPGMRYCVPIVPTHMMFAEVAIGQPLMPGSALMFLIKSVPYSQDEEEVQLGMWSAGEGRMSMADVINDWIRSELPENRDPDCPNSAHQFKDMQVITRHRDDKVWMKANDWSILINNMCYPCWVRYQQSNSGDFGLDPNNVEAPRTNYQNATMNQLRNRNRNY